ncbi:hypothetical protein [uncultured Novosphingobium sp.]|uniref:hypothetical protein n=1 Tax=uncultured Novosphingobium sp. TaxID=292277 RepID=UPI0037480E12
MSGLRKIVTAVRNGAERSFGVVTNGSDGMNGWTPILAPEQDGTRTLLKVMEWMGGSGAKPMSGMYLATSGYVTAKADAFNFNASKRVRFYQAVTGTAGVATLNFAAEKFAVAPLVIPIQATTAGINGTSRSTLVAGSLSVTQAQVKVEVQALITGALTALIGATVNALVIEQ